MNGSSNDCKNGIKGKVISKYFSSSQEENDSLSDFQEKKTCVKGPKNFQSKPVNVKTKCKNRAKGQKDIRTALKGNNKLVEYTKEFDNVCKVLGVDIDTEQLQLAIALSKSLHDNNDTGSCNAQSEPLCSQERTVKIRKTLQEYGFTVPDIKIPKKCKKLKKSSKLLLTSEFAKKQIITRKYTKVLAQHLDCSKHFNHSLLDNSDKKLYHISTNITYNEMKDFELFCAINSIEISHRIGYLLRDWSKIPGRPESPNNCRPYNMNFSEIDCSQDELDIVLSGSLKAARELITHKSRSDKTTASNETKGHKEVIHEIEKSLKNPQKVRSCSPDLFEEEVSNIFDNIEDKAKVYSELISNLHEDKNKSSTRNDLAQSSSSILEQVNKTASYHQATHRKLSDLMEITKCVDTESVSYQLSIDLTKECIMRSTENHTELLQKASHSISNKTKRVSNDLMEVTECVSSNKCYPNDDINTKIDLTKKNIETKIDLTQNSDDNDSSVVIEKIVETNLSKRSSHCNSDTELPSVHISKVYDDTIILNDEDIQNALHESNTAVECVLSEVNICKRDAHTDYKSSISSRLYDVNQTCDSKVNASQNFFDDYIHDHSDAEEISSKEYDLDKIDLTQSSNESGTISELINKESLGKKVDISIDYDDLYDNANKSVTSNSNISKEDFADNALTDTSLKYSIQHSGVFEISDQELNYSINKSRHNICQDNFGGISVVDKSCKADANCKYEDEHYYKQNTNATLPLVDLKTKVNPTNGNMVAKDKSFAATPKNCSNRNINNTPNDNYLIKTDQVTPMLDYNSMSTPERNKELEKYGLKPFKRKRAVQLLTYLYNQTHPVVESCTEYASTPLKKRKVNPQSPKKILESHKEITENETNTKENCVYEVTKALPDIKTIECSEEDWVFQKREKPKIHSCRVPLHIAFQNYVSCRQRLREAILRYEPVNIDVIHKDLVSQGHRYDPKDLLRFLDKKCITVKTAENNRRNNRLKS